MAEQATKPQRLTISLMLPLSILLLSILQIGQYMTKNAHFNLLKSILDGKNLYHQPLLSCDHEYSVELLSLDPLVLYVNSFISDEERRHLLSQA